ncbi:hypothetical protein GF359_05055 [candidate division WOR-3 bacterium]|uniref:LysM domain-containing protein n=1 Tax=candidate division WOR-3 bacterium TaxID=2052148 RepID=A0A9D5KAD5_UNCW3|nr:hypothetical protein [candidate division WOR-3 bacterium]MBD3364564.1 hypothetical protein [candidate division WOR-3 bacterium]
MDYSEKGFLHRMREGEDIWLLAELYYGDASLWWIIYHVNIEVFGDDPEYVWPGLELFIPFLEVSEEKSKVPVFISHVAYDPAFDPMILLVRERYSDSTMCLDLYEENGWKADHVIKAGDKISYPARAEKPAMRRAESWRHIFYRR